MSEQLTGHSIGHTSRIKRPFSPDGWVRFRSYVLTDNAICPATGSKLERYDPWAEHRRSRQAQKALEPPYQSLVSLLERLAGKWRPGKNGWTLTPESKDQVLTWCNQHGLLGILPHQARFVALAPRWQREPFPEGSVFPSQELVAWGGGGWQYSARQKNYQLDEIYDEHRRVRPEFLRKGRLTVPPVPPPKGARRGDLVPSKWIPPGWPSPFAVLENLDNPGVSVATLGDALAPFYSGVTAKQAETFHYTFPGADEFWRNYREPLDAFLDGAWALRNALQHLEDPRRVQKGCALLNSLMTPVSSVLEPDGDNFRVRWFSPSLLASFAMMVHQDLAGHRKVRLCKACGSPFLTGAYDVRYCSKRCQYREQKRRHRAKHR